MGKVVYNYLFKKFQQNGTIKKKPARVILSKNFLKNDIYIEGQENENLESVEEENPDKTYSVHT